jgi:hypothetical protein
MKMTQLKRMLAALTVAGLAWSVTTTLAQDSSANAGSPSAPQLAYGVPQILQLEQAKVGDATIVAYVRNSGTSYGLNADQIIYLRQQGVSDAVITAMLSQPRAGVTASTAPTAPVVATGNSEPVSTATVAPTVTYLQTVPATTYYYQTDYYPSYAWYPPVTFSFGWGGYYGGGWHGGFGRGSFGHGGFRR